MIGVPPENQESPILLDEPSRFTRFMNRLKFFKHWSRRRKLIVGLLLVLIAASAAWFAFARDKTSSGQSPQAISSVPLTVASPLTGIQVTPELAKRPITAIMIENSPDARPQSGLKDAGVVFEAIAEGGITRFVTLFQETQPQYVGPVRSVRPYYLDWVAPFKASVVHVGGSPAALAQVRGGMRDLDQFFNSNYYWRVNSRYAPHNVYTSFAKLDALNKAKGFKFTNFTTWPRKQEQPRAIPTAKTISLTISGYYYDVDYTYDAASNSYYRKQAQQKHLVTSSANDSRPKQLHPKVVIAMIMSFGLASDGHHSKYGDIGKGKAYIFQDGGVTAVTWRKKSASDQISFTNAEGKSIDLNAGQTWLTAVSANTAVKYAAK